MTTKTAISRNASDSEATVATPRSGKAVRSLGFPTGTSPLAKKGMGLGTRFFLAAALLVLTTLGITIAIATVRANQIAEATIRETLQDVPRAFSAFRNNFDAQARSSVRSLADDVGTKAILSEEFSNPATYVDFAKQKANALGARTLFLLDREGILLARNDRPGTEERRNFRQVRWVASPIETWMESSAIIREGPSLAVVASAAVLAGDKEKGEARFVGVLAASFGVDDSWAKSLKNLTGGQVGFLANTAKRNESPKAEISVATSQFGGDAFLRSFATPETLKLLFTDGKVVGPLNLAVAGDQRIVMAVPILSATSEPLGAFVVSRSRDEETAAFRQIRNTLIAVGIALLLVSFPVSYAMGRGIAKPLHELAEGAIAIRDGKLDVELPEAGKDEVGVLARAFRAMVGELREKAQLEELLADLQRRPVEATVALRTIHTAAISPDGTTDVSKASFVTPHVGELLGGRYEVLSILGRGGMGAVYRAFDRELEEDVAVKVLMPSAFDEGTSAVQNLKQEIRLARKISHPNVVRTHDFGEANGMRFLTMEFVPGTTLRELTERRGGIAIAPGLQIAKQLCRGLAAVHEAGIVHRDIKPHNIMVLPNGVLKLMDFGIASSNEGNLSQLEEGQTIGTPYYMSPEQARGEPLDARSDLYSVGVVLFELFTAQRPFEGRDPLEVMRKQVAVDPPRPSQYRADMPDLLERIILACLAKDPSRRPPTANELYAGLMRVAV
jgi:serine/threonine-protein kinase